MWLSLFLSVSPSLFLSEPKVYDTGLGHVWNGPYTQGGDCLAWLIHGGWVLFPRPFLVPQREGAAHVENEDEEGKDGGVRKGNRSRRRMKI